MKDFFFKVCFKALSFLLGSSFCFTFVFITDGTLGCSEVIFSLSAFSETFKEKKKKLRLGSNKRKGNDWVNFIASQYFTLWVSKKFEAFFLSPRFEISGLLKALKSVCYCCWVITTPNIVTTWRSLGSKKFLKPKAASTRMWWLVQ